MNHEQYFKQMTQYCKDNPTWAQDLAEKLQKQRQSPAYKEGLRDGNMCQADAKRCKVDADYAAGVEEGFNLYMVDCPVL